MKIKKNYIHTSAVVIIILVAMAFYLKYPATNSKKVEEKSGKNDKVLWMVDKNGYLYYPLDRGQIKFGAINYSDAGNLAIKKIVYESSRGNIYGLLALPKNITEQLPGIILLPGAGVSKESELRLAEKIAGLGAVVLTIDQRGVGETDGNFPSLEEDYANFLKAKEPLQHLMVYDALRAFDLLHSAPFVDSSNIIIAGESLGGRIAVIAAAIDRNIKGALVISTAGLGFKGGPDKMKNTFIDSIDSDRYIELIAPRKLVMIHNINDKNIHIQSALNSYSLAQQPKRFIYVNDTNCNHGYCDSMYDGLVGALDYLVEMRYIDDSQNHAEGDKLDKESITHKALNDK